MVDAVGFNTCSLDTHCTDFQVRLSCQLLEKWYERDENLGLVS